MGRLPATVVSRFEASRGNVLGVSSFCFQRLRCGNISSSFALSCVLVSLDFEEAFALALAPPSVAVELAVELAWLACILDCLFEIGFHRVPLAGPIISLSMPFAQKNDLSAARRWRPVKNGTSWFRFCRVDEVVVEEVVMLRRAGLLVRGGIGGLECRDGTRWLRH